LSDIFNGNIKPSFVGLVRPKVEMKISNLLFKKIFRFAYSQSDQKELMAKSRPLHSYYKRMQSLGKLRSLVIICTGSDNSRLNHYFNPPPEVNLEKALYQHLLELWDRYPPIAGENGYDTYAVTAAGLLTFGELSRLDYILDNVPPHRIHGSHGSAYCKRVAFKIVAEILPLPKELPHYSSWIQGSREVAEVKQWIHEHRSCLAWNPDSMEFDLLETVA
jgi:hypothetical protein